MAAADGPIPRESIHKCNRSSHKQGIFVGMVVTSCLGSTRVDRLSQTSSNRTRQCSMRVVFRRDLAVDGSTYTLAGPAVVEPAMKGALHACAILDLSADSEMSSHM